MKKTISILLTILILLNICNPKIYAVSTVFPDKIKEEPMGEYQASQTIESYNEMSENGTVTTHGDQAEQTIETNVNPSGFAIVTKSIIGSLFGIFPRMINWILSLIVYGDTNEVFTIEKLLTNQYALFDIDFFNKVDDGERYADTINEIKDSVAIWYVSIRNITAVGMVLVLVYVAIRMAISTVADQKAKYKKMFIFWLEALATLFLLQYFIIIILNFSKIILNMLNNIMVSLGGSNIEEKLLTDLVDNMISAKGAVNTVVCVVLCFMMAYYELKFFVMYLMRVLRIAFYMIISPLVCLIYPIDKIGDGKAQSFLNWIKEYIMEIFLQCIHLGLYIVFIFSAGEIIATYPVLGVIFLAAISNGEKIVRKLLNIETHFAKGIKETRLPGQG